MPYAVILDIQLSFTHSLHMPLLTMATKSFVSLIALAAGIEAGAIKQRATSTQPDWFQTSPDNYAGKLT
jgi:hypothetical protein